MSTKNLARTVIEGGRRGWDKYCRRQSLREWRNANSEYCRMLVRDGAADAWDAFAEPVRDVPYRWRDEIHADKVMPCKRFLASRAGRPWDAVRSEICRRFSRRTLAGKHVVDDHLLRDVEGRGWHWDLRMYRKFYVDDAGILRHNAKWKY